MSKPTIYPRLIVITVLLLFFEIQEAAAQSPGTVKFHFVHSAEGKLLKPDSSYTNAFGESFILHKLKYYISNISFDSTGLPENVQLVNAFEKNNFTLQVNPGQIQQITFLVGVDSSNNCSGAQTGALDPLNDMFWTWNSGYVMFKMEGQSPQSTADLNRIEHHIGGYKGPFKTMRSVKLSLPQPLVISPGQQQDIVIGVNLDKYFQGVHEIRIKDNALLMTAGEKASQMADNFPGMFYIKGFTE